MELISVIVPVYQVEKQLNRCVESLVRQTYSDLEIILVDDGSPDACGAICDEWKHKDGRIRVIHKENEGLGMARNSGLDIAVGVYVAFVDSDDYVEADHMMRLYTVMRKHDADLAVGGFIRLRADGRETMHPAAHKELAVSGDGMTERILLPVIGAGPDNRADVEREMCVWSNLYRRDNIEQWGLRFVSERDYVSEDIFFNMRYFMNAEKAVLIPDCTYIYLDNAGSLTNTYRPDRMEKYCMMLEEQIKLLRERNLFERAKQRLFRTFLMKTKRCISLLSCSGLKFADARRECGQILANETLRAVLAQYRAGRGAGLPQRLILELIRRRAAGTLLVLYKMKYSIKYNIKFSMGITSKKI